MRRGRPSGTRDEFFRSRQGSGRRRLGDPRLDVGQSAAGCGVEAQALGNDFEEGQRQGGRDFGRVVAGRVPVDRVLGEGFD